MLTGLQVKIALAACIAVVIAAVAVQWQHKQIKHQLELERAKIVTLETELTAARDVNRANQAVIDRLEASRELDRTALKDLADSVSAVSQRAVSTRTIIREIERNDPVAADFLSLPLPDSVRNAVNARAAAAGGIPHG